MYEAIQLFVLKPGMQDKVISVCKAARITDTTRQHLTLFISMSGYNYTTWVSAFRVFWDAWLCGMSHFSNYPAEIFGLVLWKIFCRIP